MSHADRMESVELPHPRTFPRQKIQAAIQDFAAEGKPPTALTVTQLRMRMGGGSWQTLREELERARREDPTAAAETRQHRLSSEVPPELTTQAATLEQLLERAGTELQALIAAVRARDRREHEREVAALRARIDELEHQLAASSTPSTRKRRRQSGDGAS